MKQSRKMVILIPARMAASRLPGKPMADIHGKPLIEHVWNQAVSSDIAPVYVATDHQDIHDHITSIGGKAVMTSADHPSGSDRIFEALCRIDETGQYQHIINLQGDLPTITADAIDALASLLLDESCDLATLVAKATAEEAAKSQIVKAVMNWDIHEDGSQAKTGRAHYFSRHAVPYEADEFWHHIGLYGWQRSALEHFVKCPPSSWELSEKLEQLRALQAGMIIKAARLEHAPGGVDTPEDLEAIRQIMHKSKEI